MAISCPCCKQPVAVPTPDVVAERYGVTAMEEPVLRAIWRGGGRPVPTIRVFDAMYADDPDGGPGQNKMYAAFKVVFCRLRKKLEGSGISIENVGFRQGYRIVLGNLR